ncbi:exodeoxyribonuclease V subunit alpha [Methylomonas sp. AM2-LC]|uniref:exodeoxyribonuclease V subunit alpha n=1 Tax=Methylomonas sp. AM2-LC TaxID=3153301 RepID=UPI003265BFE2
MTTPDEKLYSRLDFGFARFLGERSHLQGESRIRFENLLLQLSAQQSSGHSCIALSPEDEAVSKASGLSSSNELTPLIIEQHRLYLHRYWQYEQKLAEKLKALSNKIFALNEADKLLDCYFPVIDNAIDWQKQAAKCALTQGLTIITGGPGTGKTTTVVKILALLQETSTSVLHMALAAPTGKAAMRLQESIAKNKAELPCSPLIKARIPESVTTLHRLLGPRPFSPYFRHCAEKPLPYDLLVVDESSMVDLALMSKLVDALKPGARLILLGDKDQLASVESGAVLADLTLSLPNQTVELIKSHRFQGAIKILADAVNKQQAEQAWQLLTQNNNETSLLTDDPIDYIVANYSHYLQLIKSSADFLSIFNAFNQFQVLCSNRHGSNAVTDINQRVEQQLFKLNKINLSGQWYAGRPIMITANNPGLQLFNGDVGLCIQDPDSEGQLRVFFFRGDGSIKKLQPARIEACETVYAMTIHKSQGSEFENILIILPDHSNPVLSKELLYTAITRAKTQVKMISKESVFKTAITHKVQRHSGLAEKLLE